MCGQGAMVGAVAALTATQKPDECLRTAMYAVEASGENLAKAGGVKPALTVGEFEQMRSDVADLGMIVNSLHSQITLYGFECCLDVDDDEDDDDE